MGSTNQRGVHVRSKIPSKPGNEAGLLFSPPAFLPIQPCGGRGSTGLHGAWQAVKLVAHLKADGRADLIIANGRSATGTATGSGTATGTVNELHLNLGGGQYSLVAGTSLTADGFNTQTLAWGEYAAAI